MEYPDIREYGVQLGIGLSPGVCSPLFLSTYNGKIPLRETSQVNNFGKMGGVFIRWKV